MRKIILFVFLAIPQLIYADSWQPSHSCRKPYKPLQFSSQWELDSFNDDVRRYKQCIMEFIEEQEDAIQNHQDAAEEAIDEWNSFVRYELN